ncbi:uncharacterized protein [Bos mutus]|uniref:uncharacterized protein n=1 Tax=Bos mutus TaxID=72004 RepID=UPI0038B65E7B
MQSSLLSAVLLITKSLLRDPSRAPGPWSPEATRVRGESRRFPPALRDRRAGWGLGRRRRTRGRPLGRAAYGEGPTSAARRSPGAAPARPNIVQHPASALAAAPGARRPLLAALAPSEPCGPRARAGRAPPHPAPLPTPPGRPGRLLLASQARLGPPPTPILAPIVHGCKTLGLGLWVCGVCAPGAPCARRRSLQGRAQGAAPPSPCLAHRGPP